MLHPLCTVPLVVRFVHTADLQLGMSRRFLAPEAQARFAQARIEAVRALGRLAVAEQCEFVVVAGDVFEANQLDRQVVARSLEALAGVPVPVYLLPGNHDPLDAGSIFASAPMPANVTVLPLGVTPVRPGVELVAAPWTSKRPLSDLLGGALRDAPPAGPGVVRIAVGHGAVDVLAPDRDNPARIVVAALEGADYVALGDRHSTTRVGERVWYSGAPEATDFDEVDPGNVLVVSIAEAGASPVVVPHRVGRWRFLRRSFSIDGADDVAALAQWLAGQEGKAETVVRLDLSGTVSLAEQARLDDVLDEARPLFAAVDVWAPDGGVVVLPDAADLSDLGVAGFARAAVEELEAAGAAGDEEARDALALLYRLAKGAA